MSLLEINNLHVEVSGHEILKGINLTINAGEIFGIIGRSGAGKSTLLRVINMLERPTAGRVLVDGVDIQHRTQHWLQSRLGYVLQTPQLFRGTVRDNIRYGKLAATDREVEAAADLGAKPWPALLHVVLPLSAPGIRAGSILVFIPALGAYLTPDLLGGGRTVLIGNLVQNQFTNARDWPFGAAISVGLMALVGVLVLLMLRRGDQEGLV